MPYLNFDRSLLRDYSKALDKEYLLVNNKGDYCSSTIIQCNSRKYHGLLISSHAETDDSMHLLLSGMDETLLKDEREFPMAVHQFPETVHPEGYLFLENFEYEKIPQWICEIENTVIRKSLLLHKEKTQLFISYEVLASESHFKMQFQPFLAFRNIHKLCHSSFDFNRKYLTVDHGVAFQLDPSYETLHIQFSKKVKFVPLPDWYYNIEYSKERERGYAYQEDLYVPGYFELDLKAGDHLIVSAANWEIKSLGLKRNYKNQLKQEVEINSFEDSLRKAAGQFLVKQDSKTKLIAGWHWFGAWGRDTFISLPGLTLSLDRPDLAREVMDTSLLNIKEGLFPNTGSAKENDYNSVDAPLWFFWALQQYSSYINDPIGIWDRYGNAMKSILGYYKTGTRHQIGMNKNGLISQGETSKALTWMDAIVDGEGVTPRIGMPVEINALWYNAVCFALELASASNDFSFINEWEDLPKHIKKHFITIYWDPDKGYLADVVNNDEADWSLRPNQIMAISLPYSPLEKEIQLAVFEKVKENLLTPRGLRTLSPDDPKYRGYYKGDQKERDRSYHQGTVWPWLLGPFAEACFKLYPETGPDLIKSLYEGFESTLFEEGVGTVSEIFEGDEPFKAVGAISQAWSVASLLRMKEEIELHREESLIENSFNESQ